MTLTTVDEMRQALLDAGESPANVASMKKAQLKQRLDELAGSKMAFDLEPIEETPAEAPTTLLQALKLEYGSPEWNNYIIGLMHPSELWDGLPKVNGLNRVANLVLGDIVSSKPVNVIVTVTEHGKSVTVNYELVIDWKLNTPVGYGIMADAQLRTFGGVADCNEDMSSTFFKHPAAIAETKAMGRALRKALALSVIAAEEMMAGGGGGEESAGMVAAKPSAKISPPLKSAIEAKAKMLNLDLKKIVSDYLAIDTLESANMEQARDLWNHINSFQQNK